MNHNDINRRCAEILGHCKHEWFKPEGWTKAFQCKLCAKLILGEPTDERISKLYPDFCTDWNAMKLLMEYAEEKGFTWIIEGNKVCGYEVMMLLGEEIYSNEADSTAPLTAALAFLKCFGKESKYEG